MLANSSNANVDILQTVIAFFCESKQIPQKVMEMLAHMGVSTSLTTCQTLIKSLISDPKSQLKALPLTNQMYDNFDMDFKVVQLTVEQQGYHMSATSASFIPYQHIDTIDLRFTGKLYETSQYNINLSTDDPKIF